MVTVSGAMLVVTAGAPSSALIRVDLPRLKSPRTTSVNGAARRWRQPCKSAPNCCESCGPSAWRTSVALRLASISSSRADSSRARTSGGYSMAAGREARSCWSVGSRLAIVAGGPDADKALTFLVDLRLAEGRARGAQLRAPGAQHIAVRKLAQGLNALGDNRVGVAQLQQAQRSLLHRGDLAQVLVDVDALQGMALARAQPGQAHLGRVLVAAADQAGPVAGDLGAAAPARKEQGQAALHDGDGHLHQVYRQAGARYLVEQHAGQGIGDDLDGGVIDAVQVVYVAAFVADDKQQLGGGKVFDQAAGQYDHRRHVVHREGGGVHLQLRVDEYLGHADAQPAGASLAHGVDLGELVRTHRHALQHLELPLHRDQPGGHGPRQRPHRAHRGQPLAQLGIEREGVVGYAVDQVGLQPRLALLEIALEAQVDQISGVAAAEGSGWGGHGSSRVRAGLNADHLAQPLAAAVGALLDGARLGALLIQLLQVTLGEGLGPRAPGAQVVQRLLRLLHRVA